jgi:hypothetical protein
MTKRVTSLLLIISLAVARTHIRVSLDLAQLPIDCPVEAEQRIERQRRRAIPYRWIVRQKVGEELFLSTGPTAPLKTHGSISESVTTTVTIQTWC